MSLVELAAVFIYFVGFWLLFRSIWTIGIATELNQYVKSGGLLAVGILSLVFSIFYLFNPLFLGAAAVVALVSVAFITYGVFRIFYAFTFVK